MKTNSPIKKIPFRMCIVCRSMRDKTSLIRVVKSPDGKIFIDESEKANGRGAYICKEKDCIEKCFKKKLFNKSFKTNIDNSIYEKLLEEYADK